MKELSRPLTPKAMAINLSVPDMAGGPPPPKGKGAWVGPCGFEVLQGFLLQGLYKGYYKGSKRVIITAKVSKGF